MQIVITKSTTWYTVLHCKTSSRFNFFSMPRSTFIGLCLQYWNVFPVCADWLLLIDLWHPNWRAARNHHRDPCRLSFIQRACSQAKRFPASLSRSYSTFPLCSGTTLIEIAVCEKSKMFVDLQKIQKYQDFTISELNNYLQTCNNLPTCLGSSGHIPKH
jgi:hypothetical protein